jgi:hypothetical protein
MLKGCIVKGRTNFKQIQLILNNSALYPFFLSPLPLLFWVKGKKEEIFLPLLKKASPASPAPPAQESSLISLISLSPQSSFPVFIQSYELLGSKN